MLIFYLKKLKDKLFLVLKTATKFKCDIGIEIQYSWIVSAIKVYIIVEDTEWSNPDWKGMKGF